MKLKKLLHVFLSLLTAFSLVSGLVACGESKTPQDDAWSIERVYARAQELGFEGSLDDLIALFKGDNGKDGKDGVDGKDGKDGVGIKSAYIDERGHLILVLSDGIEMDAGKVTPGDEPATEGLRFEEMIMESGEKAYLVKGLDKSNVKVKHIVIPSEYNGCAVIGIAPLSFNDNPALESVVIPGSVQVIDIAAFVGCVNLKKVTLGYGVEEIGVQAFRECASLMSIALPDSIRIIGSEAFEYSGLTEIVIPDSVTLIDSAAFGGCDALRSVTIGGGVTEIGWLAFIDCENLTDLTIGKSVTLIDDGFVNCGKIREITYWGTKTQWEAVKKTELWDCDWTGTKYVQRSYIVHCTDGDIEVKTEK